MKGALVSHSRRPPARPAQAALQHGTIVHGGLTVAVDLCRLLSQRATAQQQQHGRSEHAGAWEPHSISVDLSHQRPADVDVGGRFNELPAAGTNLWHNTVAYALHDPSSGKASGRRRKLSN